MKRMFHQKVKEIRYGLDQNLKNIEGFSQEESLVIKKIGESIYQDDNIYLTTNIRKLWNLFKEEKIDFEKFIQILRNLNEKELLDIKFLEDVIYSSVIVSPKMMFIFYKNYIQEFPKVIQSLIFEIKEKENRDSFKIAENIGVKLVVVNNILDYLRMHGIVELMRYSGTPLPGGKSFIILKFNNDKINTIQED
ncbi:MAG: hypothetical protein RMJ36_00250 [Candidatus Calescibacterium sp.]|nr:hypothetical protein [Candidatus Calescibacterium sp.]MDW8132076.1 hypothetical protein [Candidatus Calescibacterium sp.]